MSVLVTQQAPDFTAAAVLADGTIVDEFTLSSLKGKKIMLFFYPLDFTFVCPSEILAHHHRVAQFAEKGVEVVGVSIDSQFTHNAWRNTAINDGGLGAVDLPLGRNVDEMLRMVDALDFHTTHGEVCPAGWQKGDEGMKDTPAGVADYLTKNADNL